MFLLRFSKPEYHSQTLAEEELRFTPIETWRNLEGLDLARGNAWEGADRIDQPEQIKEVRLRFAADPSLGWVTHELAGPIITHSSQGRFPATHGLCFNILDREMLEAALKQGSKAVDFSKFIEDFGPSLLFVKDVPKFLELVIAGIKSVYPDKIESSSHGIIEYVDDHHHGEYSIYCKPSRFKWQKEFRIVVQAKDLHGQPLILMVPELKSVCQFIENLDPEPQIVRDAMGDPTLSLSAK